MGKQANTPENINREYKGVIMSKVFGTNQSLFVDDEKDSDGEINVFMPVMACDSESVETWLDKQEALKLISHLQSVFNI